MTAVALAGVRRPGARACPAGLSGWRAVRGLPWCGTLSIATVLCHQPLPIATVLIVMIIYHAHRIVFTLPLHSSPMLTQTARASADHGSLLMQPPSDVSLPGNCRDQADREDHHARANALQRRRPGLAQEGVCASANAGASKLPHCTAVFATLSGHYESCGTRITLDALSFGPGGVAFSIASC